MHNIWKETFFLKKKKKKKKKEKKKEKKRKEKRHSIRGTIEEVFLFWLGERLYF